MTLYDYQDCPFAKKVRIVLAEKDLSFDTVTVDLRQGQQRSEDFLKLNPFGKVPVLIDEGCVMYESYIITEYLNDEYPHPPELLPEDSSDRARVRMLADYADRAFTLPVMALAQEREAAEPDAARIGQAKDAITKTLAMLERELEGKEYLAGEFSLADVAFTPALLQLDNVSVSLDSALVNVRAWATRLAARPSVGAVMKLVA
ncbi:MAG: glutathione S-transferase [Hyphomicrobiaceae bacterium]|jgi:glutathione S-transferase